MEGYISKSVPGFKKLEKMFIDLKNNILTMVRQ